MEDTDTQKQMQIQIQIHLQLQIQMQFVLISDEWNNDSRITRNSKIRIYFSY